MDNFCLVYTGPDPGLIPLLKAAKAKIESRYPEINVAICVRQDFSDQDTFSHTDLPKRRGEFAFIREFHQGEEDEIRKFV